MTKTATWKKLSTCNKKVSELEELQDSLAEKWLKEKKTDGIKEIGENFGKNCRKK